MVLDEIFERFVQQSPVTVMVRATLEHALAAQVIDALFERTAERRYSRHLPCSSVVDLMAAVVTKVQPAVDTEPGCPPNWSGTPPAPSGRSSPP